MKDGNIFAACFYLMLLHKMGGSESFRDKQTFFNAKLLKHHQSKGHKHTRLALRVDRADIIGSSYRATKWFSEADWCRLFEVEFEGELGIDHGGVKLHLPYLLFRFLKSSIFIRRSGESGLKCCARSCSTPALACSYQWRKTRRLCFPIQTLAP